MYNYFREYLCRDWIYLFGHIYCGYTVILWKLSSLVNRLVKWCRLSFTGNDVHRLVWGRDRTQYDYYKTGQTDECVHLLSRRDIIYRPPGLRLTITKDTWTESVWYRSKSLWYRGKARPGPSSRGVWERRLHVKNPAVYSALKHNRGKQDNSAGMPDRRWMRATHETSAVIQEDRINPVINRCRLNTFMLLADWIWHWSNTSLLQVKLIKYAKALFLISLLSVEVLKWIKRT